MHSSSRPQERQFELRSTPKAILWSKIKAPASRSTIESVCLSASNGALLKHVDSVLGSTWFEGCLSNAGARFESEIAPTAPAWKSRYLSERVQRSTMASWLTRT